MLKKAIKYTDFNDVEQTDEEYFNITRTELVRLEAKFGGYLAPYLQRIVADNDTAKIYEFFESVILMAYGRKSDDGKRFDKSDELRLNFQNSAAYDALITQMTDDGGSTANEFIMAVMPAAVREAAEQAQKAPVQDKPTGPPRPPTPPVPAQS